MTFVRAASGPTTVRTYRIDPESELAPLTGRLRVGAITECAASGACLPPTTFAYQQGTPGFEAPAQWGGAGSWSESVGSGFADFDGDGHRDFWYFAGNQLMVRIALAEGRFGDAVSWATLASSAPIRWFHLAYDFNGDGLPDIAYADGADIIVRLNTGDPTRGFAPAAVWTRTWNDVPIDDPAVAKGFADVNGDGLPDLWYGIVGNVQIGVQLNTRSGFAPFQTQIGPERVSGRGGSSSSWSSVALKGVADLDGDGRGEFWFVTPGATNTLSIYFWNALGSPSTPYRQLVDLGTWSVSATEPRMGFADLNGDGLADIWTIREPDNRLVVRFNRGRGVFGAPEDWADLGGSPPAAGSFGFADLNADGRADLWYVAGSTLYVATSNGAALRAAEAWAGELPVLKPGGFGFDQFSAKGRPDFWFATSAGELTVRAARGPAPDLLAQVTSGLGAVTTVTYRSMTDPEFYVKSTGAIYPVIDLQVPIHLVSDTSAADGAGNMTRKAYSYRGWRMAVDGRGSLGFEYRWVSEQVGIGPDPVYATEVMHMRQDFPFVGQVTEAKRYLLRNGVDVLPRAGHYYSNPMIYRNRTRPGPAWVAIVPVFDPPPAVSETRSVLCYRRAAGAWEAPMCGGSAPREPGYRYHVFKSAAIETTRAPEDLGSILSAVTSELTTDEWGNTTYATVRSSGRCTASRHIFAQPDSEAWAIGRLLRSTVRTRPSESDCAVGSEGDESTRTAAFEYFPDGLLKREVVEPGSSDLCVVSEYEYDGFGNGTRKVTRNCNGTSGSHPENREAAAPAGDARFEPRVATTRYDAGAVEIGGVSLTWEAGQFPTAASNALGHTETRAFDSRTGQLVRLIGPNGITSSIEYDELGRKLIERQTDPSGAAFSTRWRYEPSGYVGNVVTATRREDFGADGRALAPPSWTYSDALGREVRRAYPNFAGTI